MTGRLVVQIVGISTDIVRGYKMDTPVLIDGESDTQITRAVIFPHKHSFELISVLSAYRG